MAELRHMPRRDIHWISTKSIWKLASDHGGSCGNSQYSDTLWKHLWGFGAELCLQSDGSVALASHGNRTTPKKSYNS
jgi:hypothetical protein